MSRYAESTAVSSNKSRDEIERTLRRYGADGFAYGWDREAAVIMFRANERQVRFRLPLPDPSASEFTMTPTGRERSASQTEAQYEQATRQRWRALALVIKAKLEAVEAGITEFESEFMAHLLLPDGSTFGDWARPQIASVYASGQMPERLALMAG